MRTVHFRMLSIVIVSGLAAVFSCAKSAPQPLANKQPGPSQQVNTPAPGAAIQPSPQQTTTASADSGKGKVDACMLLTSKEVQSVQGEALKEAKSSWRSEGGFSTSQCFFTLPTFTNSISLTVTRRGDGPGGRDPKQFWKETFDRETESEQARDKDRNKGRESNEGGEEEEEKGAPPQKIRGVGDEAFWAGSRFGGALYVLKGNASIRVSVGGIGDQQTKIKKSKALAQRVLKHL